MATLLLLPALRPWQPSPDGSLRVAAVQGDVPGDGTDVLLDFRQVTENYVQATVDLASDVEAGRAERPDFVLWPENSTAVDPFADQQTRTGIQTAAAAIGVPILVGAIVDAGAEHVLNQGIVWDPVLGGGDRYTKRHPVPFGEYIPWRNVFGDSFGKLDMIPRDMVSGTRSTPLRVAGTQVADAICFDIAYDDGLYDQVDHGAEMVVVQTSNAMFIHTAQIEQQFEISRARAIEFGRYVAIASINGRSGIIAPDGSVVTQAEPRTTVGPDGRHRARRLRHPRHPGRPLGRPAGRPVHGSAHGRRAARLSSARRPARPRRGRPTRPSRRRAGTRAGDDHEQ